MMEISPRILLYLLYLVLAGAIQRVAIRLPVLLWTGVVLALLGLGLLYAFVAIQFRKPFPPGPV